MDNHHFSYITKINNKNLFLKLKNIFEKKILQVPSWMAP